MTPAHALTGFRQSLPRPAVIALGAAVLLLIATRQAFTVPFTGLGLSPAQLILFVMTALWALTRLTGQRSPAGLGLLSAVIVVQLLFVLVSYGLSAGRFLNADQRSGADRSLLLVGTASIAVFMLVAVLRSRPEIEFVLRAITIAAAISGFFGLVQYAAGVDIAASVRLPGLRETEADLATQLLREGLVRPQGAAAVPLELGAVMTIAFPIALGVLFAAHRRGERAWPWALAVVVIAGGGVVSLSRSVFLGIAAALIVMVPRWPVRRLGLAALAAIGAVVLAALSGARLVSAIGTLLSKGSQDYSLASRSDGRTYVYEHFANHFWFGQGPGTYDVTTQKVLDNQYLSQLMETGAVGLLLFVAVLIGALVYAIRAAGWVVADGAELANGIAGALAAIVVVSAVLDTAGFVQTFTLIWLVIGLAGACWRLSSAPNGSAVSLDRPGAVAVR